MTAGLTSPEVLDLTATYTMFEAVEGLSRLIRQTQEAADNTEATSMLKGSEEHVSGPRSAGGVVHKVQNATALSLECWIAPPSQPTREGAQACSPFQSACGHGLQLTHATLAQWQPVCPPRARPTYDVRRFGLSTWGQGMSEEQDAMQDWR